MLSAASRAVLALTLVLPACSLLYQPNIQQGNVVTPQAIAALKLGMTREQVRYLLGTPPVRDPFHKGRWDYYFSFQKDGGPRIQQHLTLIFAHGELSVLRGAARPTPPFPMPTGRSTRSEPDAS